jgi:hypothetical protein
MAYAQTIDEINRVEFNSGTRTYREQLIVTKDSLSVVKEDFRTDERPQIIRRATTQQEWDSILKSLGNLRLSEIETLQSPTMKRTFDAAAHGSIIITTDGDRSFTHGFDDENPHKKLRPLMEQIRKLRKE